MLNVILCFHLVTFLCVELLSIGLRKYGAYTVRIAAESTNFGVGPFSVAIEFRTLEDCKCSDPFFACTALYIDMVSFSDPEAPRDISVKMEEDTTILVTWLPPENPNGKIVSYQMVYAGYNLTHQVIFASHIYAFTLVHIWQIPYIGVIMFTTHTRRMLNLLMVHTLPLSMTLTFY